MAYEVNTPVFDGPFDLLLHLILQEEVDIHEVSLLRIVEAYLVEVQKMQTFDLEIATEFLLIAATLVELKTRRLLPGKADMDLDEELALWEERDLLLARLLDCKTFKDVASVFSNLVEKAGLSFARMAGPDVQPKPPTTIDMFHVAPIRASVADALMELLDVLPSLGRVTFAQLTEAIHDRIEVVCRFLGILELYKQGRVDIEQSDKFGDIQVLWTGGNDIGFEAVFNIDDYEG